MSPQQMIEVIAATAHEANRLYCLTLGDKSQPHWEDAPDWQRESACNGVKAHLLHNGMGPRQSHANWLSQKVAEGWAYGETKDAEKKTHPCIKQWEDLPEAQRRKDVIFSDVVESMRRALTAPMGLLQGIRNDTDSVEAAPRR